MGLCIHTQRQANEPLGVLRVGFRTKKGFFKKMCGAGDMGDHTQRPAN